MTSHMAWAITITIQILVAASLGTMVSLVFPDLLWAFFRLLVKDLPKLTWRDRVNFGARLTLLVAAMFVIADIVIALVPYTYRTFSYLMRVLGLQAMQISIGLTVVVVGFLAYWFKLKSQSTYGIVEVLFGGAAAIITAKYAMNTTSQLATTVATLVGSAYVVSRGVSNYFEGTKKGATTRPWRSLLANAISRRR